MRSLTNDEINILLDQGCTADDWANISVADGFDAHHISHVAFYGTIALGATQETIDVGGGFLRHTGISSAVLRNVTVGDNCLIANIGTHINNCTIGDHSLIVNVGTIDTTDSATYGQGVAISVLNEVGEGNITLFSSLTAQIAALMLRHGSDSEFTRSLQQLIAASIITPQSTTIGSRCRIVNTPTITNSTIGDDCEIDSARRIAESTLDSIPSAPIFIGAGATIENSIISAGTSIMNGAMLDSCFVGEACQIKNGFSAEASLFFDNCYMAHGEACAAFCGPFTASHHKSTLLIGAAFSFYNAGSSTNFSNHAYKMGPIHHGTLERGAKTASGTYIPMPAHIGQFSVCFGNILFHPDTRRLPFSYIISYNNENILVPGRNLTTVGLYRDIHKWQRRDRRPSAGQHSIINFDWLSPFAVEHIITAKQTLENLRRISGEKVQTYNFQDYIIKASSAAKGIKYYDIALRIYMGAVVKRHSLTPPVTTIGQGSWGDLAGLLLPLTEEERLVAEVKNGTIASIDSLLAALRQIHHNYDEYRWAWSYQLICDYYHTAELSDATSAIIHDDYVAARRAWLAEIRKDALREYDLGDVPRDVLDEFLSDLDHETEFEDVKYDS